ncbi:unnamed protein product [Kluyveromyces dobzhanskii CBS 2104]|uniref:WGS project CCBQ000000000 data, contig 00017 n=1 Tax=Kluyveromyces dobzhanskii CBS 2104 TaxID=1427455 RepID=A0A0A8L8A0_9SACH|nr:unnamed protein product [Kluyveromyces dobzhanskii CBS 2104]
MLISLETIHQNIAEMYPVLLRYWCSVALFKVLRPVWYFIPFGFVMFPLGLLALNKEAYSSLKRYQLQKNNVDSKTVAYSIMSKYNWFWATAPVINDDKYIFGNLSLRIASLLETLSLLPEIMDPLFDAIGSLVNLNSTAKDKTQEKRESMTAKKSGSSLYEDYDLLEDILLEFKTSATK